MISLCTSIALFPVFYAFRIYISHQLYSQIGDLTEIPKKIDTV